MKIFVIGSISCEEKIKRAAEYYKRFGYDVEYVKSEPNKPLERLVENAFNNIYAANKIVVVPKEDGSIGTGTTYEIAFAHFTKTPVSFWREET